MSISYFVLALWLSIFNLFTQSASMGQTHWGCLCLTDSLTLLIIDWLFTSLGHSCLESWAQFLPHWTTHCGSLVHFCMIKLPTLCFLSPFSASISHSHWVSGSLSASLDYSHSGSLDHFLTYRAFHIGSRAQFLSHWIKYTLAHWLTFCLTGSLTL